MMTITFSGVFGVFVTGLLLGAVLWGYLSHKAKQYIKSRTGC